MPGRGWSVSVADRIGLKKSASHRVKSWTCQSVSQREVTYVNAFVVNSPHTHLG